MKPSIRFLLFVGVLAASACTQDNRPAAVAATTPQASQQTVTAKVNGREFNLSATPTAVLQPGVARQYGIEQRDDTLLVLVSVMDAQGNAVDLGTARVTVSVGKVPDAPVEISLKPVKVEGYTNLIGTVTAPPPVKLQLQMDVQDGGARTRQSFVRDVLPR